MTTETRKYITENSGMADWVMDTIDALLPILPGDPEKYVTPSGRLNAELVDKGVRPHSHSTGYAANLILSLWTGSNSLSRLASHSGQSNRKILAEALRIMADRLEN